MSFENLILPAEFYQGLVEWSVKCMLGVCAILIIISFVSKCIKAKFYVPLAWFINVPKIVISAMAVWLVFFYDYESGVNRVTDFENMYFTSFLVGILAVIELLTCFASWIKDICDMWLSE